jgi:oxygen-independent coproporphyrinogen-3 oxidase
VPVDEYLGALRTELDLRFHDAGSWHADTVYFGGGTPSRLGGAGVARMLEMLRERIDLEPNAEVTLEANPDDIDRDSARLWRDAGVNRLSIGSQSFDDRALQWMHRTHDSGGISRAVDAARSAGLENISLDLLFALPERTERSWESDVSRALALEPSHLSLYGLTIESHTPLGRWHDRGDVVESPEERYESEFLHAHDALTAAGFDHYEVSNFGKPGLHSRHNAAYWTGASYAGLGPSAHDFDGDTRRWNVRAYADWVRRLADRNDPLDDGEQLSAENRTAEQVYLGLRTIGGLTLSGAEIARVEPWAAAGWARLDVGGRLVLTPLGWLRIDSLAADLTHVRSRY